VDVIDVATRAQEALEAEKLPIQVAVMGCVVNGPGEAREADIGIAAGRGRGHLFIKGQVVRVVPEEEMVEALLDEARKLAEEGIEARLAAADRNAEEISRQSREQLVEIQGDANQASQRRARVAEVAEGAVLRRSRQPRVRDLGNRCRQPRVRDVSETAVGNPGVMRWTQAYIPDAAAGPAHPAQGREHHP
jgi:hypothetical protein